MAYKNSRPTGDIRLRNWDAGRLSSLKLAVQRLEQEVNRSLGSSVEQSAKRKLRDDRVPFILDFAVTAGFRQAAANWTPPPGLNGSPTRNLLFYEVQHDSSPAFSDPTIIETPQTHVLIGGLALGETRSFRARVVSTLNEVSRWTATTTVTLAQSQIQQTALSDVSMRLLLDVGQFETILEETYQPLEANATLNAHIALAGPHFDTNQRTPSLVVTDTFRGGAAHVQFRWRIGNLNPQTQQFDMRELGQRTLLSVRPGYSAASDKSSVRNPLAFGSFASPFYELDTSRTAKIQLQAALCPGSEWMGSQRERSLLKTDPVVFVRNAQLIQVLKDL